MTRIRPKLEPLFYFTGTKKTTPDCSVAVQPWFSPVASYHIYMPAVTSKCSLANSFQGLPFFMEKFGPRYTEWTTTAHEQMPGHHLEVSRRRAHMIVSLSSLVLIGVIIINYINYINYHLYLFITLSASNPSLSLVYILMKK